MIIELIFSDDSHFSDEWLARIKPGITDNYRLKVGFLLIAFMFTICCELVYDNLLYSIVY